MLEIVKQHKLSRPGMDELVSPTVHFNPTTKIKSIADIFSADPIDTTLEAPHRILIEGPPGVGKTVLVKEAAYKWATGELSLIKSYLLYCSFVITMFNQSVHYQNY